MWAGLGLLFFFISFNLRFRNVEPKAEFSIIGKRMDCVSDASMISNVTCHLDHYNRTTSLWSLEMYFQDNVVIDNLFAKLSWYYKTANDENYKTFLGFSNVTIDLCQYLFHGNSMLVDMFLNDLKKQSNLIHACPFKGHAYVKGLNPNMKRFSAIMPSGNYYIWIIFYIKSKDSEQIFFQMKMYVDIKTVR